MKRLANIDIKYIKGVGEARAKILASEFNIRTVRDLLYYFPARYADRSRFLRISEFTGDMPTVQVKGRFLRFSTVGEGAKMRLVGLFHDGVSVMEVVWFRRIKSIEKAYHNSNEYILFGKPSFYNGDWSMVHPEIEVYDPNAQREGERGIYSITEKARNAGFTSRTFHAMIENVRLKFPSFSDTIPVEIINRLSLMPLTEAIWTIHNPLSPGALQKARERLKFEELYYVELHILRYSRQRSENTPGHMFKSIGNNFNSFYNDVLPFELTGAQKRVIKEIRNDTRTGKQMNRLLQGDVGSGKTMVAFLSMLIAIDNGFQACIMAPTEILATQHYEAMKEWADKIGINLRLLTGSTGTKERREIHDGLLSGEVNILVGTHAVIEDTVNFQNLGLVIIDEQHRFGVAQRAKLWKKNSIPPHVLVMTATPIPRTLAMTVYGDLDVSVIDELPPGRKPVTTLLRYEESRMSVYASVTRQLVAGRQAYIVYPLINENDKLELKSLAEGYEAVCRIFPKFKVCYVHGRMKPKEKDYQMQQFVSGEAQIMVATTVIEVGVNVPNASVMIIENAERFGLSQLHQLRGRVGRGADQSYCILMSKHNIAKDTRTRLEIMTETTDGFEISEADMKLRGPGDIEGTQQSGLAFDFRIASLATDGTMIQLARQIAIDTLDSNTALCINSRPSTSANKLILNPASVAVINAELELRFGNQYDWSRIS